MTDLQEEAGQGLVARVHDRLGAGQPARQVRLGSAHHAGVAPEDAGSALQVVLSEQHVSGAVSELARFDLVEDLRSEAPAVVTALEQGGVAVQLLSGDRVGAVQRVAAQAGIAINNANRYQVEKQHSELMRRRAETESLQNEAAREEIIQDAMKAEKETAEARGDDPAAVVRPDAVTTKETKHEYRSTRMLLA